MPFLPFNFHELLASLVRASQRSHDGGQALQSCSKRCLLFKRGANFVIHATRPTPRHTSHKSLGFSSHFAPLPAQGYAKRASALVCFGSFSDKAQHTCKPPAAQDAASTPAAGTGRRTAANVPALQVRMMAWCKPMHDALPHPHTGCAHVHRRPERVCLCPGLPQNPQQCLGRVFVLQHPHELKKALATVPLLPACLEPCTVVVGRRFKVGSPQDTNIRTVIPFPLTHNDLSYAPLQPDAPPPLLTSTQTEGQDGGGGPGRPPLYILFPGAGEGCAGRLVANHP